jgi:hypothetical protein
MPDNSLLVRPAMVAACGAMLMAATAPAAASETNGYKRVTVLESSTTGSQAEKKYCISFTVTGSLLPQRECRTRADWEAQGATFKTVARKVARQNAE